MSVIYTDQFRDFFTAIHGQEPFPWQTRLARDVLETGWPPTLALPTASGKTAILDVATFALAAQAHLPAAQRTAPRRIALVVDRRIVVDDAYERAKKIASAINNAKEGILLQIQAALQRLGGEKKTPLATALLRGGIYREDRWARTPAQPVLVCSTVDQVGSRLLFRGYGLSNHAWPIHAGLIGNDTLIILDEAHCSRPFLQTLDWIAAYRAKARIPVVAPFAVVAMTATPRDGRTPFTLQDADRTHPILSLRLKAEKIIKTVVAAGKKDTELVAELVAAISGTIVGGRFILVVVNRVKTARDVHQALSRKRRGEKKEGLDIAEPLLLTGRCRSAERDDLLTQHRQRLMAGRVRGTHAAEPCLVVVATQCVEVGADLDADALITESCPLDALRQRLGRLDRLGHCGSTTAIVVSRADQAWNGTDVVPDDAIYGEALARTWHWLNSGVQDGGIDGMQLFLPADPTPLSAPAVEAPVIFPAYCDLWAQTGPEPAVSPEPAIFLHGPRQGEPEVQFVWRADLDSTRPDIWAETIALCPPVSGETLSLPLSAARRWLAGASADADRLADIPTSAAEEPLSDDASNTPKTVLRWQGPDRSAITTKPEEIRPGDVLILSVTAGGCDIFGWNPESRESVQDIADQARGKARRAPVVRLIPALAVGLPSSCQKLAAWTDDVDWPEKSIIAAALSDLPEGHASRALIEWHGGTWRLRSGTNYEPHPGGTGLVLIGRAGWATDAADFTDEDDSSSQAPHPLTLIQHLGDVERWARLMSESIGLSTELVDDLALAGRLHDLGKADPRFQVLLHGGNQLAARKEPQPWAKSTSMLTGAAAQRARELSGYPDGGRHELLSLRLADSHPEVLAKAHNPELVRHLVASHHGRCRPFAPIVIDERSLTVGFTLDDHVMSASSATGLEHLGSGVAERFWSLTRTYGWWGLAYLETCLRLADHRASEEAEHRRAGDDT